MYLRSVSSIISGISFVFFGLACFLSDFFINEFFRYGLSEFRILVGILEVLGGVGCLVGVFNNKVLLIASLGLSILMIMGVLVRIKINDTFYQTAPAIFYFLLNGFIFFHTLKKNPPPFWKRSTRE
ncbi:MAG: DoxX family protein [Flavobacteriaceae bacterium]|nr:DoxX family protein [Flavobacteriaceae bacterium]